MTVTASDIASMTRCSHRVYLDRHGNPDDRVPYPDFLQILWESGRLHEEGVVAALDISQPKGNDFDSLFKSSIELMTSGAPLIYQSVLKHDDMSGIPDILKKVDKPSRFGQHSYVPVEIKFGMAWIDSKANKLKPKPHYIAQLCAYAEILGGIQGFVPETAFVIDSSDTWVELTLRDFWPEYERLRNSARDIDRKSLATMAGKKAACDQCAWFELCDQDIRKRDDVTLVSGIGESHREKLWHIGIRTVSHLVDADHDLLVTVKGIGKTSATKWTRQARVQKSADAEIRERWIPPSAPYEVSYDIEDFFFSSTVYLHGLLIRRSTSRKFGDKDHSPDDFGQYEAICGEGNESEESIWHRFMSRVEEIDRLSDYIVYVYSHHEVTYLSKLRERHGSSAALERFMSRFVDLFEPVRNHFVFPTESTSLKSIASFCGFSWRDPDPGGSQSIAWWANYLKDPVRNAPLRDRVIRYNEDDTRASLVIKDWMERMSR